MADSKRCSHQRLVQRIALEANSLATSTVADLRLRLDLFLPTSQTPLSSRRSTTSSSRRNCTAVDTDLHIATTAAKHAASRLFFSPANRAWKPLLSKRSLSETHRPSSACQTTRYRLKRIHSTRNLCIRHHCMRHARRVISPSLVQLKVLQQHKSTSENNDQLVVHWNSQAVNTRQRRP